MVIVFYWNIITHFRCLNKLVVNVWARSECVNLKLNWYNMIWLDLPEMKIC